MYFSGVLRREREKISDSGIRNKGTRAKAECMFQRVNSLWWREATTTLFLLTLSRPLHGSKSTKEEWDLKNYSLLAYRCLITCHPNIPKRVGLGVWLLETATAAEVCWLGQSLPGTNLKEIQFTQQNARGFKGTVCFDKYIEQCNHHPQPKFFSVLFQTSLTPSSKRPRICFPSLWTEWVSPRVSHKWNYTVYIHCFVWLLSLIKVFSDIHPCCCVFCLPRLLLMDIWAVCSFQLSWIKLPWTFTYKS